jgi:hypothetical protein
LSAFVKRASKPCRNFINSAAGNGMKGK